MFTITDLLYIIPLKVIRPTGPPKRVKYKTVHTVNDSTYFCDHVRVYRREFLYFNCPGVRAEVAAAATKRINRNKNNNETRTQAAVYEREKNVLKSLRGPYNSRGI